MIRSYEEELEFIEEINPYTFRIKKGFVPNMQVEGRFYVSEDLKKTIYTELKTFSNRRHSVTFIPALKQIANVASLPGIVGHSIGLPDIHSGYGFAIGNLAAFDMNDPKAVVSPGGVGFDINCGIRLISTNLTFEEVNPKKKKLNDVLFDLVPVGVGAKGLLSPENDMNEVLENGMDWAIKEKYSWKEDKEHCEEFGRMMAADASLVSQKAKSRGLSQLGTLGSGNHYLEVQVVDDIFDQKAADTMGIGRVGQVCIMIHSGSRGLGHQIATDALTQMKEAMERDNIKINDKQLACARIHSVEGQSYLKTMAAAANFAWVNRSCMTYLTRNAFEKVFKRSARKMEMKLVYDVSHNMAKVEDHIIDGKTRSLLVHRKGATRAFPPHHPLIPEDYQEIGQPVLIGGTMGTCSYVLTGTAKGMSETFGSTCHGAGRAVSRGESKRTLKMEDVIQNLEDLSISFRVASQKRIGEEAPGAYKDVNDVVNTCHNVGISKKCVKLRPIAVIKG